MLNRNIILAVFCIMIINIGPVAAESVISAEKISFRDMNNVILMFRLDCKRYPQNLQELNKNTTSCNRWQQREELVKITDFWGRPYHYKFPKGDKESRFKFELHSYGEDGVANTDDDMRNWMY